jgi:hypothetical protein
VHVLYFRRNPRVARVVFMAAPHRGSSMADSFVGMLGNSLTRVPPLPERGLSQLARANPNAMRPEAAAFFQGGRFSAVRTLSPRSTALIAVSELPIEVPYHSVIGQLHPGPKERGSDGVVPYWSSHLPGAQSELIVRSGHGVIDNPDAIREVVRILHLEQRPKQHGPVKHRIANGVSMREAGIDICGHRSKSVKEFDGQKFDCVIRFVTARANPARSFSARQSGGITISTTRQHLTVPRKNGSIYFGGCGTNCAAIYASLLLP